MLKEGLSIDTTLTHISFNWTVPLKGINYLSVKKNYLKNPNFIFRDLAIISQFKYIAYIKCEKGNS